jgi:selenocysteine lyase/cysteine desulfurase
MPSTSTYDLRAIRAALPALAELTYMNSGGEGIMAEPVLAPFLEMMARFERNGYWLRRTLDDEFLKARAAFGVLLNADAEEVAITRSGTEGVAFVLGSIRFQPADELLIGSEEHPAILHPALALQQTDGVKVKRFTFHYDPQQTLESFAAQLTPRTRLAAFSHVSCETGIRVPAASLIRLAHERGVPVLLDGAQSVGAFPVDFRALDCDYLTGSAHKWLCGPKGTGVLVVRRDRLVDLWPRYVGGGSLDRGAPGNNDSFDGVQVAFNPTAARFEMGMRNPAIYAGIRSAIEYLNGIGWEAIADHEREMVTTAKRRLAAIDGVRVQTPSDWDHSSAVLNFAVDGVSGDDVRNRLWSEWKIVQRPVHWPEGVRLSIAYFASLEDIDRVVEAVTKIRDDARV